MSQRRADRETFDSIRYQLSRLDEDLVEMFYGASRAIDEMLRRLTAHLNRCEHELEAALSALASCRARENADCSYEVQAVDLARNRLADAEAMLMRFRDAARTYQALEGYGKNARERDLDDIRTWLRRFTDTLEILASHQLMESGASLSSAGATHSDTEHAVKESPLKKTLVATLFGAIGFVASVLNIATGVSGVVADAVHPPSDTALLETFYQNDFKGKAKYAQEINRARRNDETAQDGEGWVKHFVTVYVQRLPDPEGVTSGADFAKVSMEEMGDGLSKLQKMMAIIEGNSAAQLSDYWFEQDQAQGLEYAQGYQRVYDAFFGSGRIYLNYNDGAVTIVNGRHRIWMAKQMNIERLPVLLAVKQDT